MSIVTRENIESTGTSWTDYWLERYEAGEISEDDFIAYSNMDTVVLL